LWTDFDINQDFSIILQDQPDLNTLWQCPDTFDVPAQSIDTPSISAQTPFIAPIPPPPPGLPTPPQPSKSRKRSSSLKEPKRKRAKKARKGDVMPSSPPLRAFKSFSREQSDTFFLSEATSPAKLPDFPEPCWEEFLIQSDSEEPRQPAQQENSIQSAEPPIVAFTAVNSTVDSTMEFTARQILLNAEFTPASSPDQSQSPSGQTESDSPGGLTPFGAETPGTTKTQQPEEREVLRDLTSTNSNNSSSSDGDVVMKEKRPRGRPRGWRKPRNLDNPNLEIPSVDPNPPQPREKEPPKQRKQSHSGKEEDQWSVRIRASIKDAMLEHLAKGNRKLRNVAEM